MACILVKLGIGAVGASCGWCKALPNPCTGRAKCWYSGRVLIGKGDDTIEVAEDLSKGVAPRMGTGQRTRHPPKDKMVTRESGSTTWFDLAIRV
jgi:hypothetical protein